MSEASKRKPGQPTTFSVDRVPKPPSIADVAREASVSTATVSRVINESSTGFSNETADRVLAAVQRLKYRPSLAGSALRSGRNPIVALMLTDLTHAYSGAVAASVEEALRKRAKTMVLCNTQENPWRQDELLLQLRSHLASGIVLLGAVASPGLAAALQQHEPIVCVVRRAPGDQNAPFVGIDDLRAGREVATHFLNCGFRRIMLIHGPLSSSATADRVGGFSGRLREAGLPAPALRTHAIAASRKELSYALASKLLTGARRPEAIFCTTDEIAFGVARRCLELGLDLKRDIMLFGFDGNPLNEYLAPYLSTIQVPYEAFGAAVGGVLDQIWATGTSAQRNEVILPYRTLIAPR
jgi:LacI family transcriptional regulator